MQNDSRRERLGSMTHEELVAEAISLIQRSNDEKGMKALQMAIEAALKAK